MTTSAYAPGNAASDLVFSQRLVRRVGFVGFVSTAMLAVASSMRGWPFPTLTAQPWLYQFSSSRIVLRYGFLILFLVATAGVCWSWLRAVKLAQNGELSVRQVLVLFALWSAPLCVAVPLFSGDVYVYVVDGQALVRGFSPYDSGISALGPEPIVHMVHPLWRDSLTMYGPVFMRMAQAIANITGGDVVAGVLFMRLVAVISVGLMGVAVYHLCKKLGRSPVEGLVFALLNPLTLFHFVSGSHNDATMLALLLAGLAIGISACSSRATEQQGFVSVFRNYPVNSGLKLLAIALCILGTAFKFPAFAGVLVLGWMWAGQSVSIFRRLLSSAFAGVIGLLILEIIGLVTGLGWGWTKAANVPGLAHPLLAPANAIAFSFGGLFGAGSGLNAFTRPLASLFALVLGTWLIVRTQKNAQPAIVLRATGLALYMLAWLGPALYPWYLTWGVVLLGLTGERKLTKHIAAVVVVVSFAVAPSGHGWLDTWTDWRRTIVAFVVIALMWWVVRPYARILIRELAKSPLGLFVVRLKRSNGRVLNPSVSK